MRETLIKFFRRVVGVYFREIEVTGNLPPIDTSGRVFVANHTNGLLDPILILTTAKCAIAPIAKSTLWSIPVLRWLLGQVNAVPIVRRRDDPTKQAGKNDEVFDKIAAALSVGTNILVFPEGVSHNEPRLLEVKTGPARMLARAHAQGARGLTFQSVALEFDERDTFRSRSLLVYGPVRNVDDLATSEANGASDHASNHASGANDTEHLVRAITDRVRDDLAELLVEGSTWPERLLIARVAEMLTNDGADRSFERWNTIGRQVEAARKALREGGESTVTEVGQAVDAYYARLAEEGLADEQLAHDANEATNTLSEAALWLSLPLAAAGALIYAVPYNGTRILASRISKSTDELSSYKLFVGLIAYPVWALGVTGASFALLPLPLAGAAVGVVLAGPFAAVAWHDALPRIRRAFRLSTRARRLDEVRKLRANAMARIEATRQALGL